MGIADVPRCHRSHQANRSAEALDFPHAMSVELFKAAFSIYTEWAAFAGRTALPNFMTFRATRRRERAQTTSGQAVPAIRVKTTFRRPPKPGSAAFFSLADRVRAGLTTPPYAVLCRGIAPTQGRNFAQALLHAVSAMACQHAGLPVALNPPPISFTEVTVKPDIDPNADAVTSYSRTEHALALHTDSTYRRVPHGLIAFHMVTTDRAGANSILAVDDVLSALDPATIAALSEPVFPFKAALYPIIAHSASSTPILRYYRAQIDLSAERHGTHLSARHSAALATLDAALTACDAIQWLTLKAGDMLVINNLRALHGRSALSRDSKRRMFRYRLDVPEGALA